MDVSVRIRTVAAALVLCAAVAAHVSCSGLNPEHTIKSIDSSPNLTKPYKNELFYFSMYRPADWEVISYGVELGGSTFEIKRRRAISFEAVDAYGTPYARISVDVETVSLAMNRTIFDRFTEETTNDKSCRDVSTRPIKVGKQLAFQGFVTYDDDGGPWRLMAVVLSGKSHTYYIQCEATADEFDNLEGLFEEVVGTFRPID